MPYKDNDAAIHPSYRSDIGITRERYRNCLSIARHPYEKGRKSIEEYLITRPKGFIYFLHPDHLGTATFVTNGRAEATQYFRNLPWGETDVEQNTGDYDNPYKFNGKELDEESGLYYYGARYYNPRLSIWYGGEWVEDYNHHRPHDALGGLSPVMWKNGHQVTSETAAFPDHFSTSANITNRKLKEITTFEPY